MSTAVATKQALPRRERDVLRRLAERKLEIAHDPANVERRKAWLALDSGVGDRVMVLAEHGGIRDDKSPVAIGELECESKWARGVEAGLRSEIKHFEELHDDFVVEPVMNAWWHVKAGNYGVDAVVHDGSDGQKMGSRRWDPPIKDLDRDFALLKPRTFSVDREASLENRQMLESVFGGVLPVRMRGSFYWTMGMTIKTVELIGLESLMLSMYDNPAGLHRLMAFLRDDHLAYADWLEAEGLYTLNNENERIGSGSLGYTADLPRSKPSADGRIRKEDLWVLLESQETVGVGPELFEEFIFPYQVSIAERFGKVYYGCCEPVNTRWHVLKKMPNLARVSVSPWAGQEFMAEALGRKYVFSRKPNPSLISTGVFDEAAIRADIRHTLDAAKGCRLEIIMKDVHTLNNEPDRLERWVQIAREEMGRHH